WSIGFERAPAREMFSRGQEKLVVLAALLAQALGFSQDRGQWPVLLLDDLASELDAHHLSQTLDYLIQVPAQVFITGTSPIPLPADALRPSAMFHVEHAAIAPLL
ncbi:MAG: DNA replication and repair protein RecF, partial [Lysobacteraceae bacterium]